MFGTSKISRGNAAAASSTLFNNNVVLELDADGIIRSANEFACKTFGYDRSEFVGMSISDLAEDGASLCKQLFLAGEDCSPVHKFFTSDKRERWFKLSVVPMQSSRCTPSAPNGQIGLIA